MDGKIWCQMWDKEQKNDPCVYLAYYWLNVGGWAVEPRGDARHWRANSTDKRTHALGLLALWAFLEHQDLVWWPFINMRRL